MKGTILKKPHNQYLASIWLSYMRYTLNVDDVPLRELIKVQQLGTILKQIPRLSLLSLAPSLKPPRKKSGSLTFLFLGAQMYVKFQLSEEATTFQQKGKTCFHDCDVLPAVIPDGYKVIGKKQSPRRVEAKRNNLKIKDQLRLRTIKDLPQIRELLDVIHSFLFPKKISSITDFKQEKQDALPTSDTANC